MFGWLSRLFGGGPKLGEPGLRRGPSAGRAEEHPKNAPKPSAEKSPNARRAEARYWAYAARGTVSEDVIAPIVSQHLMGGNAPAWPQREGHRVITRTDGYMIIATDGLTDAHDNGEEGLPYEIMIKIPGEGAPAADMEIALNAFEFGVLRELAFNALGSWPDLRSVLEEDGAISVLLPSTEGASPFVAKRNEKAAVGVLLTAEPIDCEVPDIVFLHATLILPAELDWLEQGGPETRPRLVEALNAAGVGWASVSDRMPVRA